MKVFIGSSSESVIHANNLENILKRLNIQSTIWRDSFILSTYTLENLLNISKDFDAAFFIFAEDDIQIKNSEKFPVTRDNVILETGLFISAIGREKVVLCTVGKPHIPTDLAGITRMPMEDLGFLEKQISLWKNQVDNLLPKMLLSVDFVEMLPRNLADENSPLEVRWKYAKEIWFVNYACTAFLAAQEAVSGEMAKSKWYQVFEKALQAGCNFKFLLTEPNTFADFDASRYKMKTIPNKNIQASALIGLAFEALKNKCKRIEKEDQDKCGTIDYRATDIALPYGLVMVLNDEEHSDLNHIKVDLYSPELSNDRNRRSFILYLNKNKDNYKFFEDQVFTLWNHAKSFSSPKISCGKIDHKDIEEVISVPQTYRQYFVGDLQKPQKINHIYDKKIEVGISYYQNYTFDQPHFHTYATEYLYVLQGEYQLAVKKPDGILYEHLTAGDFYVIPKLTPYASKANKETKILFMKSPSLFDKVNYQGDDLMSFGISWD